MMCNFFHTHKIVCLATITNWTTVTLRLKKYRNQYDLMVNRPPNNGIFEDVGLLLQLCCHSHLTHVYLLLQLCCHSHLTHVYLYNIPKSYENDLFESFQHHGSLTLHEIKKTPRETSSVSSIWIIGRVTLSVRNCVGGGVCVVHLCSVSTISLKNVPLKSL